MTKKNKKTEAETKLVVDLSVKACSPSESLGHMCYFILGATSKNNCAVEGDHPPTHNTLSTGIKGVSHECPWVTGAPVQHTGLTHIHTYTSTRRAQSETPVIVEAGGATNTGTQTPTDIFLIFFIELFLFQVHIMWNISSHSWPPEKEQLKCLATWGQLTQRPHCSRPLPGSSPEWSE